MVKQMAILETEGIEKTFGSKKVVDGVSFQVSEGALFGLLGPNGAGKTTTIRMIMGIIEPDKGSVYFRGEKRGDGAKKDIGYLPEERGLYDEAKVLDVLEYLGSLKGMSRSSARKDAMDWLDRMDLSEHRDVKIKELSKGMAQKVQFIASILHSPELAILDEPFAGLDPVNQELFKSVVLELKEDGMTILLSSHRMNMVEELCDKIFMVHEGREVLSGELPLIKEGFGKDLVNLRYSGDPSTLRDVFGERISEVELNHGSGSFYIEKGFSPDQFIRELPEGIEVTELSVKKPPLHDIFVSTVRGDSNG